MTRLQHIIEAMAAIAMARITVGIYGHEAWDLWHGDAHRHASAAKDHACAVALIDAKRVIDGETVTDPFADADLAVHYERALGDAIEQHDAAEFGAWRALRRLREMSAVSQAGSPSA
jgi:alpha-L-fucosidase